MNTHTPQVSVIIPCYNSATSLERSVDSALEQQIESVEVVVIDDGSTDSTWEVICRYGDKVRGLQQANQGQGAARNAGLQAATGKHIAFLDADDYWLPGMLRKCLSFLDDNSDAIAVSAGTIVKKWGKEDQVVPGIIAAEEQRARVLDNFFEFWAIHDHIRTGSCVIRHDTIKKAGLQLASLRISQDVEYWGYLATHGSWGFIPEPLFVTDGTPSAAVQGWMQKYKSRRKLCPTVQEWQSRILPRLNETQRPWFEQMRGRIAANYAHAKVLGGDPTGAREIVDEFGHQFPKNWSSSLMRWGLRSGSVFWALTCKMLVLREYFKAMSVQVRSRAANN